MYIAGLNLQLHHDNPPVSHDQGVEGLSWISTAAFVILTVKATKKAKKLAKQAGEAKALENLSTVEKAASIVQVLATWVPPNVYLIATAFNKMYKPDWMQELEFPRFGLGVGPLAMIRTVACITNIYAFRLLRASMKHLGDQWHWYGVREKSKHVQSGPYAVIRHPLYSAILISQASQALMWWNYIPLISLAVTAAAFVVKIPAEERLREEDTTSGIEYSVYKTKVQYRLIPGVW